jgi:hypothetical protein
MPQMPPSPMCRDCCSRTPYKDSSFGIASRVLARPAGGTVTLFAFDACQELSEDSTAFEALVLVLEGALRLTIGGTLITASSAPKNMVITAPMFDERRYRRNFLILAKIARYSYFSHFRGLIPNLPYSSACVRKDREDFLAFPMLTWWYVSCHSEAQEDSLPSPLFNFLFLVALFVPITMYVVGVLTLMALLVVEHWGAKEIGKHLSEATAH